MPSSAKAQAETILLSGNNRSKVGEDLSGGAINPGYLLEGAGTGTVVAHSTASGTSSRTFAIEQSYVGRTIKDAYASGESVSHVAVNSGDDVLAVLAAGALGITAGDVLESAGDGTLRFQAPSAATSESQRQSAVAIARETVDNSGGGTEVFIKVRVL